MREKRHKSVHAKQPLWGKRVLVTRALGQSEKLTADLKAAGAIPIVLPTIAILPPKDPKALVRKARTVETYDWLIFTSRNGVTAFFESLFKSKRDARALYKARICAIGPATRDALFQFGIRADVVPEEYVAEGVLKAVLSEYPNGMRGKRILIARAAVARDLLPIALRKAGAKVDVVDAYRTGLPDRQTQTTLNAVFKKREVDIVTFTSSSTVQNLVTILGTNAHKALERVILASIGPITTKCANDLGLKVSIRARTYTTNGLLRALVRKYAT